MKLVKHARQLAVILTAIGLLAAATIARAEIQFLDPVGDDNGNGEYVYPTDPVYAPGSFDMTEFTVTPKGKQVTFKTTFNSNLKDPWGMGSGFSVQMVFIFIDTDGTAGSGYTEGVPGLNVNFAPEHAWDKVVILSPQKKARVTSEVKAKAAKMAADIIVADRTKARGKAISGNVKLADLGGGDPATWGYQVLVQSNEGFPAKEDVLMRRVNEFEGQHRFGGGNDYMCDPHVLDMLAGAATGAADEADAQYAMLSYECDAEGNAVKSATLTMIRK